MTAVTTAPVDNHAVAEIIVALQARGYEVIVLKTGGHLVRRWGLTKQVDNTQSLRAFAASVGAL